MEAKIRVAQPPKKIRIQTDPLPAGGTDKSYGIHVARLAGVPRAVVDRAIEVLTSLEAQHVDDEGRSLLAQRAGQSGGGGTGRKTPAQQFSLFEDSGQVVVDLLRKLDLDNMTPVEALLKLKELKEKT